MRLSGNLVIAKVRKTILVIKRVEFLDSFLNNPESKK